MKVEKDFTPFYDNHNFLLVRKKWKKDEEEEEWLSNRGTLRPIWEDLLDWFSAPIKSSPGPNDQIEDPFYPGFASKLLIPCNAQDNWLSVVEVDARYVECQYKKLEPRSQQQ